MKPQSDAKSSATNAETPKKTTPIAPTASTEVSITSKSSDARFDSLLQRASDVTVWGFRLFDRKDVSSGACGVPREVDPAPLETGEGGRPKQREGESPPPSPEALSSSERPPGEGEGSSDVKEEGGPPRRALVQAAKDAAELAAEEVVKRAAEEVAKDAELISEEARGVVRTSEEARSVLETAEEAARATIEETPSGEVEGAEGVAKGLDLVTTAVGAAAGGVEALADAASDIAFALQSAAAELEEKKREDVEEELKDLAEEVVDEKLESSKKKPFLAFISKFLHFLQPSTEELGNPLTGKEESVEKSRGDTADSDQERKEEETIESESRDSDVLESLADTVIDSMLNFKIVAVKEEETGGKTPEDIATFPPKSDQLSPPSVSAKPQTSEAHTDQRDRDSSPVESLADALIDSMLNIKVVTEEPVHPTPGNEQKASDSTSEVPRSVEETCTEGAKKEAEEGVLAKLKKSLKEKFEAPKKEEEKDIGQMDAQSTHQMEASDSAKVISTPRVQDGLLFVESPGQVQENFDEFGVMTD